VGARRHTFTFDEAFTTVEETLRPDGFAEFVGQTKAVENLKIAVRAARKRGEALQHVLLTGLPGLGKTTLARIIAAEMGGKLWVTGGPVLKRPRDLAHMLTSLKERDVLFIDEIHRMSADVEEFLYSAMEDYFISIPLEKGSQGRTMNIPLKRFTLIGATTREGLLSEPFMARFTILEKLELYPVEELIRIVRRSAGLLKVKADEPAQRAIAERSRGTPRWANRYLFRLRDWAQVRGDGVITARIAAEGFDQLAVDDAGLEETHRKYLRMLAAAPGRAVGLKTLAAGLGEELDTIEEVYEPHLLRGGYVEKTARGRRATDKGLRHVRAPAAPQGELFEDLAP
jgi:Holliday junction DNA helicase RuvB